MSLFQDGSSKYITASEDDIESRSDSPPNPIVLKRFRCWICRKKYEKLDKLDRHMLKKHVDNGNNLETGELENIVEKKPQSKKIAKQIPKLNDYKVRKTQVTKGKEPTNRKKVVRKVLGLKQPDRNEIIALRKKSNKPIMCYLCFKFCEDDEDLADHLQEKHRKDKLKCKKCRRVFKIHGNLEVHYLKIHMMITVEEPNESIEIDDSDGNEAKKKAKSADCQVCGLILSSNRSLKRHMQTHSKPVITIPEKADESLDGFRCSKCEKYFKLQFALNLHEKNCK